MSNRNSDQMLYDEIIRATRIVIAASILFNQQMAETLSINATDLQLMNLLNLFSSLTPKQLAEKSALSTPGITVALDRLEKAGHIKRVPNPNDRRSLIIEVVSKSVHPSYKQAEKAQRSLLSNYSRKELEIILDFLNKVGNLTRN